MKRTIYGHKEKEGKKRLHITERAKTKMICQPRFSYMLAPLFTSSALYRAVQCNIFIASLRWR